MIDDVEAICEPEGHPGVLLHELDARAMATICGSPPEEKAPLTVQHVTHLGNRSTATHGAERALGALVAVRLRGRSRARSVD